MLYSFRPIETFICDFGDPHDLLSNNAIVSCHTYFEFSEFPPVICPRVVNNTEYVWHPQPTKIENGYHNAYVGGNGKIRSVAIAEVVVTDRPVEFVTVQSNPSQSRLHFDIPRNEFYVINERRLIFICGPRDLFLSDILQRHLDRLESVTQMRQLLWNSVTPLAHELGVIGKGLGIFFLYRGETHLPLQGCGSRLSPLFNADYEVTVDPVTGTRSCVVDPMSNARIGFVCEGRIEPADCMKSLLDTDGKITIPHRPHFYWSFDHHRPWVVAQYFQKLAFPPFNGECKCVDPETSRVKARMELRSKTDYVCDIASKIFRHRIHPIRGPWCSVVLHPGSTLTIRFPIENGDTDPSQKDSPVSIRSRTPPNYLFKTEFRPKNLMTLRQLTTIYDDIYRDVIYHKVIAGDALEWDASNISRGEIKLKYRENKPLTLIRGLNLFFYHWTLKAINNYVFDNIRAVVNVSFAFTHHYKTVGCDRASHKVFDSEISKMYCSTKRWSNTIGQTYECTYNKQSSILWAGIHCLPDEVLMPDNCDSTGYDLKSNRITPLAGSLKTVMMKRILGFQLLRLDFRNNRPFSYACVCVDKRGYEKSRIVFDQSLSDRKTYTVRHKDAPKILVTHMLVPLSELGLPGGRTTPPELLMIQYIPRVPITLHVGTSLIISCNIEREAQYDSNNLRIRPMWLPRLHEYHHYTANYMADRSALVHTSHSDSLATTPGGFEVHTMMSTPAVHELGFKSNRGGIIISKNPIHIDFVPMTFVCGKYPKPSDFITINSEVSSPSTGNIVRSSVRYTWHVVEIHVETTDPYMQGCGVTYESDELFKPETPQLYDASGRQIGCKIDIQNAKEAAFYCPAPYVLDPPNCFDQIWVNGEVKNVSYVSKSFVASRSNHFVILRFDSELIGPGETLRQTPPLECRCVTIKGVILSTIQIENYYAK
ncbi:hypothetical protein BBBOND_0110910 [Babesia bigemina]|uniref:6-Cys domain-containing protein n=1 Tax=Babesia bigemina TaxID=5866 RepID=A0A061D7E7_BABBI|nr:hypothetical protein BBBOND_0110910 [Babesia bigemina]CDR94794.1 hypothetical protein BBBOND_0110910 [Babesia bigemina]|eukprot:XP_012766980.1 hypothetical protein BBBOND_0110910 [Babesia bigemina]